MKVPTQEELIHLKIQAAMRENAFPERAGHHWYLVAGEYEVPASDIEEFEFAGEVDEEDHT